MERQLGRPWGSGVSHPGFAWELRVVDGTPVLSLFGELDLAAAERGCQAFDAAIPASNPTKLVVDLSDLGFLDCAGIGVLVSARKELRARGSDLALRIPSQGPVRRVLDLLEEVAGLHWMVVD